MQQDGYVSKYIYEIAHKDKLTNKDYKTCLVEGNFKQTIKNLKELSKKPDLTLYEYIDYKINQLKSKNQDTISKKQSLTSKKQIGIPSLYEND